MKKSSALATVFGALLLCAAPMSLQWSPAKTLSLSVDTADARIGRPLTPMSVAGVNRRVHRRAYYGAAAAGAAAYGVYLAPDQHCIRVEVDGDQLREPQANILPLGLVDAVRDSVLGV